MLTAILDYQQQQFLESHAPTHYTTPNGQHVTITYTAHQAPSVHVILQEMFGQLSSPLLAQGQVPLCFTLLSPARRPLQTTSDLAHFWRNSYFDVRKDMKGRYPKHRWPEEPLLASPGAFDEAQILTFNAPRKVVGRLFIEQLCRTCGGSVKNCKAMNSLACYRSIIHS